MAAQRPAQDRWSKAAIPANDWKREAFHQSSAASSPHERSDMGESLTEHRGSPGRLREPNIVKSGTAGPAQS
jgi:hypothetical protein